MTDLSQLFGAPQVQRRATVFDLAAPKAAQYKRQLVMGQAMEQDLSPEDGPEFFKFVGRRLFELGDIEGAMAVGQKQQEMMAAQAAGQQQQFENQLEVARFEQDDRRLDQHQNQFDTRIGIDERRLDLDAALGAARINASLIGTQETRRSNKVSEELKRDRLEFDKSEAELNRVVESLKVEGLDLSEAEGKAVSLAAQIAPAMELLNGPELANYTPSQAAIGVIQSLAASSGDFIGAARNLFKSNVYAKLSTQDKRYIAHGLTVADMSLRDRTGATMNAGEVAGEFMRLLPQPGDPPQLIQEKRIAREAVLDSILVKVPDAAMQRLLEVSERGG